MSPASQRRRPSLAAAVEAFVEHGYAGTSLDRLLAATALDAAAFRRRFTDKEGCFLAAYDRIVSVAQGHLAASLPREEPWPTRVAANFCRLLELIDANPAAARLVLVESQLATSATAARYTAALESLAPFMLEGRECPTAPGHLPTIIGSVLPAGVAFSLSRQLLRGEPVRDLYPELLRFLLLPYLGEAETAVCLARSSRFQ